MPRVPQSNRGAGTKFGSSEEQVLLTTELQIEKLEVDEIVAQSRHS